MRVVIVGRTRMGDGLCIGGITESFENVRIQPEIGYAHPNDAPYRVGDVWELSLLRVASVTPPHVEDMQLARAGTRVDRRDDVGGWLLENVDPWRGSAERLFDGTARATDAGRAYVGREQIPSGSVGFWIPDRPLLRQQWDERIYYDYTDYTGQRWRLSYAGDGPSMPLIPAGILVRVSLARWWSPPDSTGPEGCYAQVSGWFPLDTYSVGERVSSSALSRRG